MQARESIRAGLGRLKLGGAKTAGENRGSVAKKKETKSSTTAPGLTSLHEAAHVGVALLSGTATPTFASRVANGPILGFATFDRTSAVALGAGAALGDHEHAFGDMMIAMGNGINWEAAVEGARGWLSGNMHIIRALASALEEHGTLNGTDLREVFDEKVHGAEYVVSLTGSDGREIEETVRADAGAKEISVPQWMLAVLMEAARQLDEAQKQSGEVIAFPDLVKSDILTDDDLQGNGFRKAA